MKKFLCCLTWAIITLFANAVPPTPLGTIYSKNTWSSTSDFIKNGTSNVTLSGNYISMGITGTPDFTYPGSNSIFITSYQTKLEKWNLKARFRILSAGVGIGFGLSSSNSISSARHDIIGFMQTLATGDADLYLMNTRGQKLATFSHNHYAVNDIIDVELDFNVNVVNFTIQNQNNGETHTLTYTYSSTSNQYVVPNTSHFSMIELGGIHELRDLQVSSNEITHANLVVIGDSKTSSQYADAFSLRYAEQLKTIYPSTVISAGGGDMVENALSRLDELIALRPQRYLISIGSNDIRHGNAQVQTQYETLVNALLATGASVYHIVFPEVPSKPNATDMSGFKNWVQSTYQEDYIPEVWNNLSTSDILKPIYDANDGYHLNQAANNMIYTSIRDHGELPNKHGLPVKLYVFTATQIGKNSVQLSWEADVAEQAQTYVPQKSKAGQSFHDLAQLPTAPSGRYTYTDTGVLDQGAYYRLKFLERNGIISYSPVVRCCATGAADDSWQIKTMRDKLLVEPRFNLRSSLEWQLVHYSGIVINTGYWKPGPGRDELTIQLPDHKAGLYILRITRDGVPPSVFKVMR